MVAANLGRRLRYLVRLAREALGDGAEAQVLPDVADALQRFEDSVNTDLPVWRDAQWPTGGRREVEYPGLVRRIKTLKNKLAYAKSRRAHAVASLRRLQKSKDDEASNRTSSCFVAKVALASPLQSSRSFAQSWLDLVGAGSASCSRPTIENIRNAFCGVVKDLYFGQIETASKTRASALALGSAASASSAEALDSAPCGVVLHVHDEASLRLRSSLDPAGTVSRGRSSKVVQHSVWVDVGPSEPLRFVPTELCALSSKRAAVIATCIYNVLESVAQSLEKGFSAGGACAGPDDPKPWLMHVLVGDGIATNEAAAKLVLPWAVRDLTSFEYFIMVVKCASHQVNLSIGSAVTGAPATVAAGHGLAAAVPNALVARREARGSQPQQSVCGVVVRLFKYLISLYYEELYSALRGHVTRLAFAEHRSAAAQASADKWEKMAELYGVDVVPERLLLCLNNGLDSWTHTLSAPALDGSAQAGVRAVLLEVLRSRLLVVDERPTLSRFFTFRERTSKRCCCCPSWISLRRFSS